MKIGDRVRHVQWGNGVVLDVKAMLPSRPPLYQCQFEWPGWGHRLRSCYAEELTVIAEAEPVASGPGLTIDPPPLVA